MRKPLKRNAIKKDVLTFLLPAFIVMCAGMGISARDFVIRQGYLDFGTLQIIVGLILIALGYLIAFIAVFTLRRSYSATLVIREDHQLITHGIYRFTRHPVYLGVIAVLIGMPVCASSPYGLLTMSLLIPLLFKRIRMEENLLIKEFGDSYRVYKEATSTLIPFIY